MEGKIPQMGRTGVPEWVGRWAADAGAELCLYGKVEGGAGEMEGKIPQITGARRRARCAPRGLQLNEVLHQRHGGPPNVSRHPKPLPLPHGALRPRARAAGRRC